MPPPGKDQDPYLPTYNESLQAPTHLPTTPQTSRGQNILDQLTLVRAQHIRSIIDEHILPLVEEQAAYGIAQTIIALLPSDIPLRAPEPEKSEFGFDAYGGGADEKKVEVIGFSSDDEPKVVRLEGQMNRTEFWRPQAVIVELERNLRERLNASPTLRSPDRLAFAREVEVESTQTKPKRNFLERFANVMEERSLSAGGSGSGSASETPELRQTQTEELGQVLVKVRLEEICLRTVNEFGLYDTMSKQCVIIRVDARC